MRRAGALAAVGAVAMACTASDDSILGRAERAMAELAAGEVSLELTAGAAGVRDPVGFRLSGRYDRATGGDLPLAEFTLTEHVGGRSVVTELVADGERAWVVTDGDVVALSDEQASALRLGDDDGFVDIGIASWVDDPEARRRADDTLVSGTVDAADLLSDLSELARHVGATTDLQGLDGDDADRLRSLVRSSEIEVVIDADDVPRTVDATIELATDAPDALVDALGAFAAPRLRLLVTLAPLDVGSLTVEPPTAAS